MSGLAFLSFIISFIISYRYSSLECLVVQYFYFPNQLFLLTACRPAHVDSLGAFCARTALCLVAISDIWCLLNFVIITHLCSRADYMWQICTSKSAFWFKSPPTNDCLTYHFSLISNVRGGTNLLQSPKMIETWLNTTSIIVRTCWQLEGKLVISLSQKPSQRTTDAASTGVPLRYILWIWLNVFIFPQYKHKVITSVILAQLALALWYQPIFFLVECSTTRGLCHYDPLFELKSFYIWNDPIDQTIIASPLSLISTWDIPSVTKTSF